MPRRWRLLLIIGSLSIIADQVTKIWARGALKDESITVIDGYWDFVLAYNTGSAFSMFESLPYGRVILSLVALVAVFVMLSIIHKSKDEQTGLVVAVSLMLGGAVGNLYDRVAYGKVTDFVLWHYHEHNWPVFNVADVALSIAVPLYIIVSVRDWKAQKKEAAA